MPTVTQVLRKLPSIMRDPLTYLLHVSREHGDNVPFLLPDEKARLINHPDLIEYVLLTNNKNYSKKTLQFETFRLVTGDGLLNSDGDFWLRQRRIAQPAFHKRKIASMVGVMQQEAQKRLRLWERAAAQGKTLDMEQEMLQLTLGITMRALFHYEIGGREAALVHTIEETLGYVMFRAQVMLPIPPTWPLPVNRRYRESMRQLDALVYNMIADRRTSSDRPDDVLSLYLEATGENGNPLPDALIRDEILTLIIAGYETAASGMTWLWYLLSQNDGVWERLQAELNQLDGASPGLEAFARLPYLRQVIYEGWRLYPPSWVVTRTAIEDDEVGGEPVAAGTLLIISPYAMHRHPQIWPDPEAFRPERFTPEMEDGRSRFAYIPFGGGPRLCIGNTFAEMETMVIMATLAQRFRPIPLPGYMPKMRALVTIRPKGGMPLRLSGVERKEGE